MAIVNHALVALRTGDSRESGKINLAEAEVDGQNLIAQEIQAEKAVDTGVPSQRMANHRENETVLAKSAQPRQREDGN